jgi:CheY-like chemotaxis protein
VFTLLEKKQPDLIIINSEIHGINEQEILKRLNQNDDWKDIPLRFIDKSLELENLPDIVKEYIK